MALAAAAYDDPAEVCAEAEEGDQVPVEPARLGTCLQCVHVQPAVRQPPCAVHCMPSPHTGRCRLWRRSL